MLPIFICGYQKSGTSLLAALMDDHPDLMVFPEETSFFRWTNQRKFNNAEEMLEFQIQNTHVNRLKNKDLHCAAEGHRDYSDFNYPEFETLLRQCFQQSDRNTKDLMDSIIKSYSEVTSQQYKRYWVEKTPRNESYYGQIQKIYPNARYIFIYRDPRDVYCSYKKNRELFFGGKESLKLGNFIHTWTESLRSALQLPYERLLPVKYEQLVCKPEVQLESICKFLDLPKSDNLFKPSKQGKAWTGNSMHGDKYQLIQPTAIGRWTTSSLGDDLRIIEIFLGKIMKNLGYTKFENNTEIRFWELIASFNRITGNRRRTLMNIVWLLRRGDDLKKFASL